MISSWSGHRRGGCNSYMCLGGGKHKAQSMDLIALSSGPARGLCYISPLCTWLRPIKTLKKTLKKVRIFPFYVLFHYFFITHHIKKWLIIFFSVTLTSLCLHNRLIFWFYKFMVVIFLVLIYSIFYIILCLLPLLFSSSPIICSLLHPNFILLFCQPTTALPIHTQITC